MKKSLFYANGAMGRGHYRKLKAIYLVFSYCPQMHLNSQYFFQNGTQAFFMPNVLFCLKRLSNGACMCIYCINAHMKPWKCLNQMQLLVTKWAVSRVSNSTLWGHCHGFSHPTGTSHHRHRSAIDWAIFNNFLTTLPKKFEEFLVHKACNVFCEC